MFIMFQDRTDAGRQLGERLQEQILSEPIVVGLARGGTPVAVEVAEALTAEIDTLIVRRVAHPEHPDVGIGVVAEGDVVLFDPQLVAWLQLEEAALDGLVAAERRHLQRQARALRGGRDPVAVAGRDVVLVDDGVSSGLTAKAAVESLRRRGAERIMLALPVGSPVVLAELEGLVDHLVCLEQPEKVEALADFYQDFTEVDDRLAGRLLQEAVRRLVTVREVDVPIAERTVIGALVGPSRPDGVVVVVPGVGSAARSPRNLVLARQLAAKGLATLLVDLVDAGEAAEGATPSGLETQAERVAELCRWLRTESPWAQLPVGLLSSCSGTAVALLAVARHRAEVAAVVSRDGRPDLAGEALAAVTVPTLFVVAGRDERGERLNLAARYRLHGVAEVAVVAGASMLFEEPGTLAEVGRRAGAWFVHHFVTPDAAAPLGVNASKGRLP
jgi:putative phosphoribosyl transferase